MSPYTMLESGVRDCFVVDCDDDGFDYDDYAIDHDYEADRDERSAEELE